MKREHLTPDGWKPCRATTRVCKYPEQRGTDVVINVPNPVIIDNAVEEVKAQKPNAIKNFFNHLFGAGKKNVLSEANPITPAVEVELKPAAGEALPPSPIAADPTPIAQTSSDPKVGEIFQNEKGRYQVLCSAADGDSELYSHEFGDLITDKATAEKLNQADPQKEFQLGDCGIFARELWNRSEHVKEFCIFYTPHGPMNGVHQFVKLNDGTYADSLGIWTEKAFVEYWEDFDPDGKIIQFEPEEGNSQNPVYSVRNPELFNTVNDLIKRHMNGERL